MPASGCGDHGLNCGLLRLRKRPDFLSAAKGRHFAAKGVVLQARCRDGEGPPRVGFTVTKKVGNAVVRNRVRRRLKETARVVLEKRARCGYDYVLVGRAATRWRRFGALIDDLENAIERVHGN